MSGSIYSWSTTAGSNSSSDGDINWNEGQGPSTVNNSARQMMGRIAEWVKDQGGALVAGGTANAITITANSAFTSYATGQMLAFKAAADNTGAATLSVNSIGAKAIRKFTEVGEVALSAGDIKDDSFFAVRYDTTANSSIGAWILQNPLTIFGTTIRLPPNGKLSFNDDEVTVKHFSSGGTKGLTLSGGVKLSLPQGNIVVSDLEVSNQANISYFDLIGATAGTQIINGVIKNSRNTTANSNQIVFYNPNGSVGAINTNGMATTYGTSSDGRRKKNLRDFDSGEVIDALEVWSFEWICGGTGYGVIAQDAQKVFPDAICEGDDGYLQADYSKFVPLLIQEIKSLRVRLAALEAQIS